MTLADIDSMARIEHQSTPYGWTNKIFEQSLKSNCCLVLQGENYNNPLGFCILQKILDELHLLNICVAREYQQRGWGQAMVRGIIAIAEEEAVKDIYLEVRVSNQIARNLYHKLGFNDIGTRAGYYAGEKGREDALQMCYSVLLPE